jgi:hypothetical protein
MQRRLARTVRTALALTVSVLAVTVSATAPSGAQAAADEEIRDLAVLREATAPFHDVTRALEAGWTEQPMCLDYPDGFAGELPGTMGHHFFNVAYLRDGGHIEPSQPELLLYEKLVDGSWRLNAVEYVIPAGDLPATAEPPRMFGQEFRFYPDVGAAGIWGLHVWVWRHNPRGLYVNLNPLVSCQYADMQHSTG